MSQASAHLMAGDWQCKVHVVHPISAVHNIHIYPAWSHKVPAKQWYVSIALQNATIMKAVIWTQGFTIVWPCIVTDSLWIKPTDALNSSCIGITILHVSGSLSAHHQEFLTVHRLWYILCSCDEPFATRSRLELQFHPTPGSKMYQSRFTATNSWW